MKGKVEHQHFSAGDKVVPNKQKFRGNLNPIATKILLKELGDSPLLVLSVREVICKDKGRINGGSTDECHLSPDGKSIIHVPSCSCYYRGEQISTIEVDGQPETYSSDFFEKAN